MTLTAKSLELFLAYAKEADNCSCTPLVGGNVGGTKEDLGNQTQLKRAGLIVTQQDQDDLSCQWVYFTPAGRALAATHNIEIQAY